MYPLQGVGHISAIEERPFRERRILYYIVYLEVTDMTIMVPVGKADDLGIRAIVGKKESQKALRLIAEEYEPIVADWKLRYQMNLDLLKKGSIIDIANVVRALYHRSRIKELPILERKLYDSALRLLIDEVSFSLLKSKDDVEELVFALAQGRCEATSPHRAAVVTAAGESRRMSKPDKEGVPPSWRRACSGPGRPPFPR